MKLYQLEERLVGIAVTSPFRTCHCPLRSVRERDAEMYLVLLLRISVYGMHTIILSGELLCTMNMHA